jgi:hypothetical protein
MNRTLTLTALVSLTALASGCETVDAARDFFAERERKSEEEKLERARQACEKFGFSKGTDAFAGCVQTEINQAKLRAAAAAAAAAPAPRSQSTTPELTPMFPPAPAPTTTTCRRTILGTLECTSR